jgi:formate-dependent phosphoribosylglycinamide formyltransferase (GAR transformylase)
MAGRRSMRLFMRRKIPCTAARRRFSQLEAHVVLPAENHRHSGHHDVLRRAAMEFDLAAWARYSFHMNAVEFTTDLSGAAVLPIPREIAAQLPKSGKARIIVLTNEDTDEAQWRAGAYEQFLRDDSAEDALYESLR